MKRFILLMMLLSTYSLFAQELLYYHINTTNGLPTNVIYNIITDAQQYVWMGSDKGLIRYDGFNYKIYENNQSKSIGISDVRTDIAGTIRCQNFAGEHLYVENDSLKLDADLPFLGNYAPIIKDKMGNEFFKKSYNILYGSNAEKKYTAPNEIYSIFNYRDKIYYLDSSFVYVFDNLTFRKTQAHHIKNATVMFAITVNDTLYVLPRYSNKISLFTILPKPASEKLILSAETNIQCVQLIHDSIIAVGTSNGLYLFNSNWQPFQNISLPLFANNSISSIHVDFLKRIWVATTDNGLYQVNNFYAQQYKQEEKITTLFNYKHDIIWGDVSGSIWKLDNSNNQTQLLYTLKKRQNITSLYYHPKRLIIGGNELTIIENNRISTFNVATKSIEAIDSSTYLVATTNLIFFLCNANSNATFKQGEKILSVNGWHLYAWQRINDSNLRIKKAIYHQPTKTIFAATSIGFIAIEKNKWNPLIYNNYTLNVLDLSVYNNMVYALTRNSLFQINTTQNNKLILTKNLDSIKNILSFKIINDELWLLSDNKLWLQPIFNSKQSIYPFTKAITFLNLNISKNTIWLSSDKALIKINRKHLSHHAPSFNIHIDKIITDSLSLKQLHNEPLHYSQNNVKVFYTLPYYENQEDIKLYYKINNDSWKETEASSRVLNLISLLPGQYDIQLQSIHISGYKSPVQHVYFKIKPPFWKTTWFYLLSVMLVALAAYLIYKYQIKIIERENNLQKEKLRLENQLRESILASVKSQMNPHFIFNALNTIQSYIYLNNKEQAADYLGKFSDLTRHILSMSNKETISLAEEMESLLLYVELEKMRFEDDFDFNFEISNQLNTQDIFIPPMIIQPYIENAIKHGLLHKKSQRLLSCSFDIENNLLKVVIDDNGIGRAKAALLYKNHNRHQSFATQANEKRLEALNKGHTNKVNVEYTDKISENGEPQGTTVTLYIAINN